MASPEKHYARNQLNVLASDDLNYYQNNDKWFHEKKDTYHRIGVDLNTEVYKFVELEPDENSMYKEAVFHDGVLLIMEENSPNAHFKNIIKDSVNAGTINYATTKSDVRKHYEMDVKPFYKYDNDSIALQKKKERLREQIEKFNLRAL